MRADTAAPPATAVLHELRLEAGPLSARFVDHHRRHIGVYDVAYDGLHGLASLKHSEHGKNLFSACGLNYQVSRPEPRVGPRAATCSAHETPMTMTRTGERSVRLFHSGEECTGLDTTLDYTLHERGVDLAITVRPRHDVSSFDLFFASYLNQPQRTALFLRGRLAGDDGMRWYEVDSAGHRGPDGGDRVYYRPFDPVGKDWTGHLGDPPLLRQAITADERTVAATLAAGFRRNEPNKCAFDGFYYALFDQFVYLHVFREPEFYFWVSASGGAATRNPAWDFGIRGGALAAGTARTFHTRLVFKPFAGVDDVLAEAAGFRGGERRPCGGFTP